MNVYVVMIEDAFGTHFIGVYATKEAAQRYVEMQDIEEIDGEQYFISEVPVQNWSVKAGGQVQTLSQLLPHTECGNTQLMSLIKNAYVCVVNGEPELFETQQQAEDHAMELSFAWYDAQLNVPAPRLAVMSVIGWLQLKSQLALVWCTYNVRTYTCASPLPPARVDTHSSDPTMLQPILAIVMGTGAGMLLTVAGQKLLNQHYQETCPSKPTHQLVSITSFIGDADYCVDKRWLWHAMEQLTPQQTALLNRYHRIHASWLKVETYEMDVMLCAAYASALDLCLAADFNPFDYPE